ncbi:uncharacterized protein LOC135160955 isoform X1 [Diachasmimorpha longicaudata]|uniref:uncharacterized protein LOC135160955 isoform X1 n=1 Tax=Diachasmimorpha longicaudata TaxID=58733 RepID=UPI0030B91767
MARKCVLLISLIVLFCLSWFQPVEGCCFPRIRSSCTAGGCCDLLCGDRETRCICTKDKSPECTCGGRSYLDASLRLPSIGSVYIPQLYPQIQLPSCRPGDLQAYQQAYYPLSSSGYPYCSTQLSSAQCTYPGLVPKACPPCKPCPTIELEEEEPAPVRVSRRRYYSQPISYSYRRHRPRSRLDRVSAYDEYDDTPMNLKCYLE